MPQLLQPCLHDALQKRLILWHLQLLISDRECIIELFSFLVWWVRILPDLERRAQRCVLDFDWHGVVPIALKRGERRATPQLGSTTWLLHL